MKCTVTVPFRSNREVEAVMTALRPEVESAPSKRITVRLEGEGRRVTLTVEAPDVNGLRAAINSYLRWLILMERMLKVTEMV